MRFLIPILVAAIATSGVIGFSEAAGPASGIIKFIFWQCVVLLALGVVAHLSAAWEDHDPHGGGDDHMPPPGGPFRRC